MAMFRTVPVVVVVTVSVVVATCGAVYVLRARRVAVDVIMVVAAARSVHVRGGRPM